jgi:hypothetical protein
MNSEQIISALLCPLQIQGRNGNWTSFNRQCASFNLYTNLVIIWQLRKNMLSVHKINIQMSHLLCSLLFLGARHKSSSIPALHWEVRWVWRVIVWMTICWMVCHVHWIWTSLLQLWLPSATIHPIKHYLLIYYALTLQPWHAVQSLPYYISVLYYPIHLTLQIRYTECPITWRTTIHS